MFVKLPLTSAKILLKNAHALLTASSMPTLNSSSLAFKAGIPKSSARLLIKRLEQCELVKKVNGRYSPVMVTVDNSIVLNVRDEMLDVLFRRKAARQLILHMAMGERNLKRIAENMGVARMTVMRALKDLRAAGLVRGREVCGESLHKPLDPIESIPRSFHRKAVRYFLNCFEARSPSTCPIVLFGEAACGRWNASLKLAALMRFTLPETVAPVISALARALEETLNEYKIATALYMVAEDAWFAQKLNAVRIPHLLLLEMLGGIFVLGEPPKDEEYFQLIRQSYRIPQEKLENMLKKGHIKPYKGDYAFTKKGIEVWRKKPINIIEFEYPCNGKKLPIISVGFESPRQYFPSFSKPGV